MLCTPGVVGRSMCYVCHFVVHTLGYFGPMLLSSPSLFMQIIRKLRRKSILPKMYVHQVETNAREIQIYYKQDAGAKYLTTKCFLVST